MTGRPVRRGSFRLHYLINGLGPGGAERSLAESLPFLLNAGISPLIICLKASNEGVESAVRNLGCEVRLLSSEGMPGWIRQLRAILRSDPPALLHTTLFEADLVGRIAAARTGIPVLTSFVNTGYDGVRRADPNVDRHRLAVVRSIDGLTARHLGAHFHAVSQAVKEDATRALKLDPERITVIKRGRNPDRLGTPDSARRLAVRQRLGLPASAEVLLNVGRQEFQKGQRHLVEALELIGNARPELVCLIAGRDGHETPALQRLSRALVAAGRLRYLGHREDVPDLMAAADICLVPSLYEGCSGVAIEAMALGLPIIASDIPPLREVVEEGRNALLVPPADPQALAAAIVRLLNDPGLAAAYGSRGVEIFHAHFTIERSAERMVDLYRRVGGRSTTAHEGRVMDRTRGLASSRRPAATAVPIHD